MTDLKLMVEIDGKMLNLGTECMWFQFSPCGCMSGVTITNHPDGLLATEEQAWRSWEPNAKRRKRDQEAGTRLVLRPKDDIKDLVMDCPHDPKWGDLTPPIPDGWVVAYQWRGRISHLTQTGNAEALCGFGKGDTYDHWRTDEYDLRDLDLCARCSKAAAKLVTA